MWQIFEKAYSHPLPYIGAGKIIKSADESAVVRSWAVERRIAYLLQHKMQIMDMIEEINDLEGDDLLIADVIIRLCLQRDRISREMKGLRKWLHPDTGAITDDMIQQARDYPISSLIEFDRAGKAIAWCHDDKSPSLHHHKQANRAHCWPCNQSFDTISVLMQRDGMTFTAAVRDLCKR